MEHKRKLKVHHEFLGDLAHVIINFLPISGYITLTRFVHKWFYKRRLHEKIHIHVRKHISSHSKAMRRNMMKRRAKVRLRIRG